MKKEKRRIIIDFEVLSKANFWMCCMKDYKTKKEHTIINDREELLRVFNKNKDSVWIGYNIKGYDQWIFKAIIAGQYKRAIQPTNKASKKDFDFEGVEYNEV